MVIGRIIAIAVLLALLAGAMLGFAALTVVMFATLRVDWSGRRELPAPAA